MAQPQQQQQQYSAPRPYVSPHTTPSPIPGQTPAFAAPPIKRPQNSPTSPASPYPSLQSPPVSNSNGVTSFQSNPYHSQGSNPYPLPTNHSMSPTQPMMRNTPPPPTPTAAAAAAAAATVAALAPQQPQTPILSHPTSQMPQQTSQGAMGPPPTRPEDDKPMDLNDIQDVMTGSGIDLKAEEAALVYDGGNRRAGSVAGPPQGYFDPQRNTLQAGTPGGRDSFYGSGPFNQLASATTPQDMEEEIEARERLVIRRRNERDQYHSNNPFLQNRIVLQKIHTAGKKTQTTIPLDGVFHPQRPITTTLVINGPEGQDRIVNLTKEPLLSMGSPMVDLLTLVSLACRERLRNVVEDSATLARGRRLTAGGAVPPDFQDITVGLGKPRDTTVEENPLIGEGLTVPESRKRSLSQSNDLPTPVSEQDKEEKPEQVPTIAYPDLVVMALQKQAEEEASFEREREAKRQKRATASLISSSDPNSRAGSISGTPGPGTPGPVEGIAPEVKLTKKEQKKREEERSAASAVKETRNAISMALGGSKKYSWMTGGKNAGGGGGGGLGSSFGKRPSVATPSKKQSQSESSPAQAAAASAPAAPSGATVRGNRVLGSFREDREDGRGIQMRDLIAALNDGHEKKTLSKSYARQK